MAFQQIARETNENLPEIDRILKIYGVTQKRRNEIFQENPHLSYVEIQNPNSLYYFIAPSGAHLE